MKVLTAGPTFVGTSDSFDRAFDAAFCEEALARSLEGEGCASATPWNDRMQRVVRMQSPLPNGFPDVLKRFVGGKDNFCMTVRQTCKKTSDDRFVRARVDNKTTFHVLCAELLRTRSACEVQWERSTGKTTIQANARVSAWLPPPLKSIAESFILKTAEKNTHAYFRAVANIMSRDSVGK